MTHYDLFAGIGGFSLALEEVFSDEEIKHVFCEWSGFPTAVLKKHWPDGEFYGDIAELIADTESKRPREERSSIEQPKERVTRYSRESIADTESEQNRRLQQSKLQPNTGSSFTVLTGGFPCQPFSAAGRRQGTSDDRYKWPEMFRVIQNVRPDWIIAENVRGLVTWNEGMVLEQVCIDLESEGYEVQPLIIPAVAVNAPHRRDRVWILATNSSSTGRQRRGEDAEAEKGLRQRPEPIGELQGGFERCSINASDTQGVGDRGCAGKERPTCKRELGQDKPERREIRGEGQGCSRDFEYPDFNRSWQEVALATCNDSVDDGLPRDVDGVSYSRSKWRQESLKAYGNAIVPQVAMEIFKAIKAAELDWEGVSDEQAI